MGSALLSHGMKLGGTGWRYLFHYKIAPGPASLLQYVYAVLQSLNKCWSMWYAIEMNVIHPNVIPVNGVQDLH